MPPATQTTTFLPWNRAESTPEPLVVPEVMPGLLDAVGRALELDLALGDLLQGYGERLGGLIRGDVDLWRAVLGDTFAELVEVGVDLTCPLRSHQHQRVLRVRPCDQVFDLRLDHLWEHPFVGVETRLCPNKEGA